jgi:Deoxynucleoside kinase
MRLFLLLDRAYADLNLNGSRRSVFDRVYEEVVSELGSPRVLVHLYCAPRTQLERIRARGRREERSLSIRYIANVNAAVRRSMSRLNRNVRVLSLDSDLCNFARDKLCQRSVGSGARSVQSISKGKNLSFFAAVTHQSILRWLNHGFSLLVGLHILGCQGIGTQESAVGGGPLARCEDRPSSIRFACFGRRPFTRSLALLADRKGIAQLPG